MKLNSIVLGLVILLIICAVAGLFKLHETMSKTEVNTDENTGVTAYCKPLHIEHDGYLILSDKAVKTKYAGLTFEKDGRLELCNLSFTKGLVEFRSISDCPVNFSFETEGHIQVQVDNETTEGEDFVEFTTEAGSHSIKISW